MIALMSLVLTLPALAQYGRPHYYSRPPAAYRHSAVHSPRPSYADVYYNGVECYVKPSALTCGNYDYNYIGSATLIKGATVYQRPSSASKSLDTSKSRKVLVYAATDGFALIRTSHSGAFGFVSTADLKDLKAY